MIFASSAILYLVMVVNLLGIFTLHEALIFHVPHNHSFLGTQADLLFLAATSLHVLLSRKWIALLLAAHYVFLRAVRGAKSEQ
jgi:hypothetical protein